VRGARRNGRGPDRAELPAAAGQLETRSADLTAPPRSMSGPTAAVGLGRLTRSSTHTQDQIRTDRAAVGASHACRRQLRIPSLLRRLLVECQGLLASNVRTGLAVVGGYSGGNTEASRKAAVTRRSDELGNLGHHQPPVQRTARPNRSRSRSTHAVFLVDAVDAVDSGA